MKPKILKGWKLLKPGTPILYGDKFNGSRMRYWIRSSGPANGVVPRSYRRYIRKIKQGKK